MAKAKKKAKKESFKKEVRPSAAAGVDDVPLAALQSYIQCPRKRALSHQGL